MNHAKYCILGAETPEHSTMKDSGVSILFAHVTSQLKNVFHDDDSYSRLSAMLDRMAICHSALGAPGTANYIGVIYISV